MVDDLQHKASVLINVSKIEEMNNSFFSSLMNIFGWLKPNLRSRKDEIEQQQQQQSFKKKVRSNIFYRDFS